MINCEKLQPYFAKTYKNLPESRYISIMILRTTQSEAIFRTEGSGEGCNMELVADLNGETVCRAVISKRKMIAVERRQGRELLRKNNLLFTAGDDPVTDENICALNRNNPCGKCMDCYLYGYAVGGGGANKSRVISDDAFSLLPFDTISDKKTFNALYDNSTMRDPVTGSPSTSIGEDEYIVPCTHFLDIEVIKDVTEKEFIYVLGNILRSKRYGAITSRIGSTVNTVIGIVGSDTEVFSTLEWINMTALALNNEGIDHPQPLEIVISKAKKTATKLLNNLFGNYYPLSDNELENILKITKELYASEKSVYEYLKAATNEYPGNIGLVE